MHQGGDDYDRLYSSLRELRAELQQLAESDNMLNVDGQSYKIEVRVCSDLKAIRELIGMERLELSGPEHVQVSEPCSWACMASHYVVTGKVSLVLCI